jgi:thiol-disulfide isomerase/thioredoxin
LNQIFKAMCILKQLIFSGALLLSFFCAASQGKFILKGSLPKGYDDFTVRLRVHEELSNPKLKPFYTTAENGKFSITGSLSAPYTYAVIELRKGKIRHEMNCYLQPGDTDIKVISMDSAARTDIRKNCILSKDPYQEEEKAYQSAMLPYIKMRDQKFDAGIAARNANNRALADSAWKEFYPWVDSLAQAKLRFFRQHPASFVSWYHFSTNLINSDYIHPDTLLNCYRLLTSHQSNLPHQQQTLAIITARQQTCIGQPAPGFNFTDTSGASHRLSNFRGRYVLLDFWASWCGPCIGNIPHLKSIREKYGDQLQIIGISLDQRRTAWVNAIKKYQLNWLHTSELKYWKAETARLYRIISVPQYFLIGPDGAILYNNNQQHDDDFAQLDQLLQTIFPAKQPRL